MSFSNINNAPPYPVAGAPPGVGFNHMGGSAVMPTSQIEMTLSCVNLLNMDILSKSDPYCVVLMKESWQDRFFEIGRTERIDDSLNPEWVKKFIISYNFETVQKLRFEVKDVDEGGEEFLGEYETTLADIVSYSGRQFKGKLRCPGAPEAGHIVIVTEEVSASKQSIFMELRARHLEKQCWIVRNDPFLVISRSNEDGSHSVVLKTEVDRSTQNPRWKPIRISARTLCNGDHDRSIKIDCYDSRNDGDHKLIGSCHTSLRVLCKGPGEENNYRLRKPKSHGDEHSGILELVNITITEEISFLDYIRGGTQMHFAVAIDFTASNGAPTDPRSLHYLSPQQPNSYEIALRSVGDIIQHYDSSKMFPAFGMHSILPLKSHERKLILSFFAGFGAKLPPNGDVSHQFPLNGNLTHPYCTGIDEIIIQYRNSLSKVQLYGPTNFSPVINNTIEIAKQFQDGKHYFVLLIITDGVISDMHQTMHSIINASKFPISIIIVGVGNADFEAMDVLDADDKRLNIDGRYAERDIVQFVPLNRFLESNGHSQFIRSQADLAKAVLAEIPEQMTGFMKSKGYGPGKATATANAGPSAPAI